MSTKKTYKVITNNNDQDHEYDLIEIVEDEFNRIYSLYASNNSLWSSHVRGACFLSLIDDGDKLVFNPTFLELGYDDALNVKILLDFASHQAPFSPKYKIIEETTILDI